MKTRSERTKDLAERSRFILGDLQVHPDRGCVVRDGKDIPLEPRPMEVLVALAEKADKVMSSSELQLAVWKTDRHGKNPIDGENAVSKTLSVLRKALDQTQSSRYIETLPGRGYHLKATVVFPSGYRRLSGTAERWTRGSPFVGLAAFDARHAAVFTGRRKATADLLDSMRGQIDNGRRFVLIAGPSGCGKTSLLRAGALPLLTENGGFGGLRALDVATCDLAAAQGVDVMLPLASALSRWTLATRPVFAQQSLESLKQELTDRPDAIAPAIAEAFSRFAERGLDAQPHAHLLLVIDHAEALVTRLHDAQGRSAFERVLCALCDAPRTLVAMIVRSDCAADLAQALPLLNERKTGGGHLDVLAPKPGEIAEIIREPARQASLEFDADADSRLLDDTLRDAANGQPDALPLLQHTLQLLYERRTENGILTWEAYRDIGGLEGAIAHRAEEVFAVLPADAQAALDAVLAKLIVIQPDSDTVTARRIRLDALPDTARALVDAFVAGRLFVSALYDGQPHIGVVHEALLRQWPRAVEWVQENRRLLMAKARLQRAASRWVEEERSADHLLNPGRPLEEALEVSSRFSSDLTASDREFIRASKKVFLQKKFIRNSSIALLFTLTAASSMLAWFLFNAMENAKKRNLQAQRYSDIVFDVASDLQKTGNGEALQNISESTLSSLMEQTEVANDVDDLVNISRAKALKGSVLQNLGKRRDALDAFQDAYETASRATKLSPGSNRAHAQLGQAAYWLGHYFYDEQEHETAWKYWDEYRHEYSTLHGKNPGEYKWLIEFSYALDNLATLSEMKSDPADALNYCKKSLAKKQEAIMIKPNDMDLSFETIVTRSKCANAMVSIGELKEANAAYSTAIRDLKKIISGNDSANEWKKQLSNLLQIKSRLSILLGDLNSAETEIIESITILSEIFAKNPMHADWRQYLVMAHHEAAEVFRMKRQDAKALSHLDQAESHYLAIPFDQEPSLPMKRAIAGIKVARVMIGGTDQNTAPLDQAISELRNLHTSKPDDMHTALALAKALLARGTMYSLDAEETRAIGHWREARSMLSRSARIQKDPRVVGAQVKLMELLGERDVSQPKREWLTRIGYRHPEFASSAMTAYEHGTPASSGISSH
jgi:DNA-binding winged helix-turn-helix (wHTH) protein/tetratricopeptide (TPR) repeat protein